MERENLIEFVTKRGGRAYAQVPVAGPELGWSSDTPRHCVDAVWFDTSDVGQIVEWSDSILPEFVTLVSEQSAVGCDVFQVRR